MSLNGLDDPKIVEAHETATSEPQGWFLLRYSTRDEVELLGQGNGGIVEMRNAVSEYDETSPLYGFLKYRRRNVIAKYLPEDCSRLIQARVAVHFNAICERFSPYDTTLEFATASELKDTKLSTACSMHGASFSTSSSTSSLRRRRLVEIAEEEEEEQRATKRQSVETADGDPPLSPAAGTSAVDPVALDSQLAASPEHSKFSAGSTSELPTFVGIGDRPTSPTTLNDADSAQTRPDLFSYSSYPYGKPKVKLGPRPSLDVSGRPQSAGNFRPVSAIPAGFKLFGKGAKKAKGSKDGHNAASQEEITGINIASSAVAVPQESLRAEGGAARPATSSGVPADSVTMPSPSAPKKPTISPEKARLMKAMQLREKKKKMTSQPPVSTSSSNDAAVPDTKESALGESSEEAVQEREGQVQAEHDAGNDPIKADSSVAVRTPSVHTDQRSDLTQSDSRPASPVVALSEADQSTKASSLSDSTGETVRAKDEESLPSYEDVGPDFSFEDGIVEKTQPADRDTPAADEAKSEETTIAADSEDPEESDDSESMPHASVSEAQIVRDEQDTPASEPPLRAAEDPASDLAVTTSEVQPGPEADMNSGTNMQNDKEPDVVVALPISSFSANIPLSPRSPQDATSSDLNLETTIIPAATPAEAATPTDTNEMLASEGASVSEVSLTQNQTTAAMAATPSTIVSSATLTVLETSPAASSDEAAVVAESEERDDSATETVPAHADRYKCRSLIDPILTDFTPPRQQTSHSEGNLEYGDEPMKELQSTTEQEANPILVAKTPVSASFSASPTTGQASTGAPPTAHMVRTTSNPVRASLVLPADVSQSSARSLSSGAAFLHQVTQQQQQQQGGNLAKKSNIGSSISQRIKALEKLSAASGDAGTSAARERPSSTFFSVKKREPSRSPSVMDRANSLRRQTPDLPPESNESSPDTGTHARRERSGSVTGRLSLFESPPGANVSGRSPSTTRRGRPESVSVTAKIIRDPNQSMKVGFEPPKDPSEYSRLDLKQSPLLVDHQRAMPGLTPTTAEPATERRSRSQERSKSSKSRQSSLSVVKDFIKERRKSVASTQGDVLGAPAAPNPPRSPSRAPSVHQNNSFSPRLSMSSRRSSLSRDHESTVLPTGDGPADDTKSTNGEKRLSRAGRFMRRLSTFSGSRSKNPSAISPTVTEEESLEPTAGRPATTGSPTIISYMGDVNVQFPDTLLWKRRNMCLDSQGFLILNGLPAQSSRQAQGTKRYHLSEFRMPYAPDVEVQELPNSVVLDFVEGTSIQLACEDRAGQINVLSVLQQAHASSSSTYGL